MRKKWTYVAVACMLLGTAPVFTGCIDTDEPAGLEDLRVAKTELLRAKAAVEAAKVAEVEAQAALLQAQAKVEEANAVKVQAEAEKIKAEAAIAQAKADYINAKTEEAKAEAQAVIDENNRIQAEWEAEAAVRQARAEAAIKQAQLATAEALAKYQTVIAALQDTKNKALKPYIKKLEAATDDYYEKLDELNRAQRVYNQQQAIMEEKEASKELLTRGLERNRMLKEKALEGAQNALARANEELKEAQALQPHDLILKYQQVLEEQNTIKKEIANLSIQAAEEAKNIYLEEIIPLKELQKETAELKDEPQTIPAITFDFSGDGSGYPACVQRGTFEYEETTYTYNDQKNLNDRKKELNWWLNEFKRWTRDDNDNAWTNDMIGTLEGVIAEIETAMTTLKASWQEAIDAYQLGIYKEVDPSAISGYPAVAEDITDYNAKATAYNTNSKTIYDLEKQKKADNEARIKIVGDGANIKGTAQEDYEKAEREIDAKYAAMDAAEIYEQREEELITTQSTAQDSFDAAKKALDDLAGSTDVDAIEAAQAVYESAERRLNAANTALDNLREGGVQGVMNELELEKSEELGAAVKVKTDAIADANKAYNDKWETGKGTEAIKLKNAEDTLDDNLTAVETAVDELKKSSEAYNNNLREIPGGVIDLDLLEALKTPAVGSGGYEVVKADLDNSIIALNKENLLATIQMRSRILYGQYYGQNVYEDWVAQVVELTDEQILAKVDEAMANLEAQEKPVTLTAYVNECNKYGYAGQILGYKERIRIAKTWLNNSDIVNAKIKQAEDALLALTDGFDKLETSIETKLEEADLAEETLKEHLEATYAEADAKRAELEPMEGLLEAILHAIKDYSLAGEPVYSQEQIDQLIAYLEFKIQGLELVVYDAQTAYDWAVEALEKWNRGDITRLEILANDVYDAQQAVNRAKTNLDNVQAALDAVIAALTNDPTASTEETPSTQE